MFIGTWEGPLLLLFAYIEKWNLLIEIDAYKQTNIVSISYSKKARMILVKLVSFNAYIDNNNKYMITNIFCRNNFYDIM